LATALKFTVLGFGFCQVSLKYVWTGVLAFMLPFAFIFGNSIRMVFESVVFLFVVHPFDVGDGINIGQLGWNTDYYTVRRLSNTGQLGWNTDHYTVRHQRLSNSGQLGWNTDHHMVSKGCLG
jgi:small-conductance mechanosensitive channel